MARQRHSISLLALCATLYAAVFFLDLAMPLGSAAAVLYAALIPIGLRLPQRGALVFLACLGTVMTLLGCT